MRNSKTKIVWTGFFWRIFILFIIFIFGYAIFFLINLNRNLSKITSNEKVSVEKDLKNEKPKTPEINSSEKLIGWDNDRINILLLGLDGGQRKSGTYLTDTIMLVSVNPKTFQSAILSIPRDLYVRIPNTNYHTKINALYTYGLKNAKMNSSDAVDLVKLAVENITGQTIPYYVIVDFTGFKKIIDILGGVNIDVPEDIKDTRYPGPNYSYETFEIKKGRQHLDAETALKYARVRHVKGGDFGRAKRQQQIIAAVRERALSLKIITNPIKVVQLINTLGEHLKTNFSKKDILSLLKLLKNINIHQATTKVLDAWSSDSLLRSTHIPLGGIPAYVLEPKIKTYAEIRELAQNIFNLKKIEENKDKIKKEEAKIALLTKDYSSYASFKKTLSKWGYKTINNFSKKQYDSVCVSNKDLLLSYSDKDKLFTLNDLTQKLDLKVAYIKKNNLDIKTFKSLHSPDILLCITPTMVDFFQQQDSKPDSTLTSPEKFITTEGNVLINK